MQPFEFNRAIVRLPARSVVNGLSVGGGKPNYDGICAEHDAYLGALRAAGVAVTILPSLEGLPDSVFVEDAALVFTEGAILLNPGAPSRLAEAAAMAPTLRATFEFVLDLPVGFVDGGDVLVTPETVIIGLSERTDSGGVEALADCLARLGRKARIVETPQGVLHLKSACSLLDDETIFCSPDLAGSGIFDEFRTVVTPAGEEAAANAVRVNDVVLAGSEYPRTIEQLGSLGYEVVPLPTSEIGRLDAGLSCMSLRWRD